MRNQQAAMPVCLNKASVIDGNKVYNIALGKSSIFAVDNFYIHVRK